MLQYRRWGNGVPLILIHGFASSSAVWEDFGQSLGDQFDVIAIDWPGFGASSEQTPLKSVQSFARAIIDFAAGLNVGPFFVMGHSMSGFVVQELLANHHDHVLGAVLYGAGLRLDKALRFESIDQTLRRLHEDGAQATALRVIGHWFVDPKANADAVEVCQRAAAGMTVSAADAAIRAFESLDYTGLLADVRKPVLIILGEGERSHPPQSALALRAALPGSHMAVLPFAGHAAHLEQPQLFSMILRQFLNAGLNLPGRA